jgi:hypothetical protein
MHIRIDLRLSSIFWDFGIKLQEFDTTKKVKQNALSSGKKTKKYLKNWTGFLILPYRVTIALDLYSRLT